MSGVDDGGPGGEFAVGIVGQNVLSGHRDSAGHPEHDGIEQSHMMRVSK